MFSLRSSLPITTKSGGCCNVESRRPKGSRSKLNIDAISHKTNNVLGGECAMHLMNCRDSAFAERLEAAGDSMRSSIGRIHSTPEVPSDLQRCFVTFSGFPLWRKGFCVHLAQNPRQIVNARFRSKQKMASAPAKSADGASAAPAGAASGNDIWGDAPDPQLEREIESSDVAKLEARIKMFENNIRSAGFVTL